VYEEMTADPVFYFFCVFFSLRFLIFVVWRHVEMCVLCASWCALKFSTKFILRIFFLTLTGDA